VAFFYAEERLFNDDTVSYFTALYFTKGAGKQQKKKVTLNRYTRV